MAVEDIVKNCPTLNNFKARVNKALMGLILSYENQAGMDWLKVLKE